MYFIGDQGDLNVCKSEQMLVMTKKLIHKLPLLVHTLSLSLSHNHYTYIYIYIISDK